MMEPLDVLMASDPSYVMPLGVAIASISQHHSPGRVRVHVLSDGISGSDRGRVEASAPGVEVRWIEVDRGALDHVKLPPHLPLAAAFRVVASELLPSDVTRYVYLDADTLVVDSLQDLFEVDLGTMPIAAVRDAVLPWMAVVPRLPWRDLAVEPDVPFFNSGVLLVDRHEWTRLDIGGIATELMSRWEFETGDQCALNLAIQGRFLVLSPRWNLQSNVMCLRREPLVNLVWSDDELRRAVDRPAIVHFTDGGTGRPWTRCSNPYAGAWHEVRSSTAWSSWSPPTPPRRSLPSRVVGRLRRAAGVLLHG